MAEDVLGKVLKSVKKEKRPKAKSRKSKKARGKTVLAFKCPPRTRFNVELTARLQRRSISNFMEQSLDQAVKSERFGVAPILEVLDRIWDVDELDRFVNFVFELPSLLTYEEAVLWKLIRNNGYFWDKSFKSVPRLGLDQGTGSIKQSALNMVRLREYHDILSNVAQNKIPESYLPEWPTKRGNPHQPPNHGDLLLGEEDLSDTDVTDDDFADGQTA